MYNGPSVSLCFYSQIGSVGLKEKRERWSTRAAALPRSTSTGEGAELKQPLTEASEMETVHQKPGKMRNPPKH